MPRVRGEGESVPGAPSPLTGHRPRQKLFTVSPKSAPNYHHLTLYVYSLMEAEEGGDVVIELRLCMCDSGATVVFSIQAQW